MVVHKNKGMWLCSECGHENHLTTIPSCDICDYIAEKDKISEEGMWLCPECGHENHLQTMLCEVCDKLKRKIREYEREKELWKREQKEQKQKEREYEREKKLWEIEQEELEQKKRKYRKEKYTAWVFALVFLVLLILVSVKWIESRDGWNQKEASWLEKSNEMQKNYDGLQEKLRETQKKYDNLRETFPLKITHIKLGNQEQDGKIIGAYGNRLYSSRLKYLSPEIHFDNHLTASKTFNFEIRYYDAWGKMEYNTSNGKVPTCQVTISVTDKSKRLSGWGNDKGGTWKSGDWTVEIWWNGVCLGSEKFKIF